MNWVKNYYIGSYFNEVQFLRFPKSECFLYLRTKKGRTLAKKRQKRLLVATSAAVIKGTNRYRFIFIVESCHTKNTPVVVQAAKYIRYLLYRRALNIIEGGFENISYQRQQFLW